ncbi:MAG: hypothetical protein N4A48_11035 [Tepidibacter sp.]|uniref:hypothetical protein n=1 Tax=Tepidibacter sp. TaxID=2529387 RepID=UPI0025FE3E1D|nr:hypothetical protein [Tepidibacter sp.]MCT4509265.1 hypothetical protein [Tepidibacter sp.]
MNKVFILILVLGISIGLLLGSSVNILANNNSQPKLKEKNEFSQPIDKVDNNQNNTNQVTKEEPVKEEIVEEPIEEKVVEEDIVKEEYVTIVIQNGFTSNKVADILYDHELIFNKNDFLTLLRCLNLSSRLRIGEKTIKRGSSMMEIIDIITN